MQSNKESSVILGYCLETSIKCVDVIHVEHDV